MGEFCLLSTHSNKSSAQADAFTHLFLQEKLFELTFQGLSYLRNPKTNCSVASVPCPANAVSPEVKRQLESLAKYQKEQQSQNAALLKLRTSKRSVQRTELFKILVEKEDHVGKVSCSCTSTAAIGAGGAMLIIH